MDELKQKIIDKIKAGEVDMRPRWHFVLKATLLISGIVLSAFLAIYLLSFIVFILHRTGVIYAPLYGLQGVSIFMLASPWLLIILLLVFLGALYLLVKKYSFSYKHPLVYSIFGVLLVVGIASYALEQTEMHDRIQSYAEMHHIPAAAPFYRFAVEGISDDVTFGIIENLEENELHVRTVQGNLVTVEIDEETRQQPDVMYQTGERLIIFGERDEDEETIDAFGIKKMDMKFRQRLHIPNQDGQILKPLQQRRMYQNLDFE